MSIACRGGQALGPSHCSPVPSATVVNAPPGPNNLLACRARMMAAALSLLASPAQRGTAKSAIVGEGSAAAAVALSALAAAGSQKSVQRFKAGCHMSSSTAALLFTAASARLTASAQVKLLPAATASSTAESGTRLATASVNAANVSSTRHMMAFRSMGTTRVISVSRKENVPPSRLPARDQREEKSHPDSAALAISWYTVALPAAVARSSLYASGRGACKLDMKRFKAWPATRTQCVPFIHHSYSLRTKGTAKASHMTASDPMARATEATISQRRGGCERFK
mmetsp:Transcript_46643/g.129770  ORF Transcript_46643/g.129770 Transcript_46643/m.129770 type:complete len:283 (+) Transcript_46643:527-1375(+)